MKEKKLNILILEDNPYDAELMIRELEKEGFVLEWKRVEKEKDFKKALAEKPDIILSDFKLPSFDGMAAIKLQQQIALEIPLIFVSGTIGEELAVECLKAGATDYVLKDRLSRLVPVVKRAIKEAEELKKSMKAEKTLRESEERFKYLVKNSNDVIVIIDENGKEIFVSDSVERVTGFTPAETIEYSGFEFLHPDDIDHTSKTLLKLLETPGGTIRDEYRHRRKGGGWIHLEAISTNYLHEPSIKGIVLNVRDITKRKKAQEKEKKHHKSFELLSETAMQFVKFPVDKNIYNFIGEQLKELIGKDSYVVVNSVNTDKNILTIRTVLGMGKLSEKVAGILGKHPVGMTYNAKDEELIYISDGKLHLYELGLYGIFLKTVPKTVCKSIEKLLNIKKIYGIGFTKDNKLLGTTIIFLKEGAGELKNKQIIETFLKQASIAIQNRQAEKALKESNENFQQVVSNITTVVWKADIGNNGAFENTYSSPVVDELLGLPAGTIKNDWDKYFRYIKPEYLERVNNAFREAIISPGKKTDCEYEVLKDNGQTAWFHSKGRCFEKNGKLHVFGSTMDITERKLAEEALKKEKATLNNIINLNPYSIQICDKDGYHIRENQAFLDIFIKVPPREWSIFNDPILYKAGHQELIRKVKSGDIVQAPKTWYNTHDLSPELADKRVCISAVIFPILNTGGDVENIVIMHENVTERKKAEQTNLRLAEIIRNASDGIILTDPEGKIHYINPASEKMSGYTQSELLNTDPANLIVIEDTTAIAEEIRSAVKTKGEWKGELFCRRKNGEIYPIDTRVFAIKNTKGELVEIAAIQQDITERKHAEQALKESEEKANILLNATHDVTYLFEPNGTIIALNNAAAKVFDRNPEEFVGKKIYEYPSTELINNRIAMINEAIKIKKPLQWEDEREGIFFDNYIYPIFDEKGNIKQLAGFARNITDSKQAEYVIRKSEEKYRTLVESIVEGIGNVDEDENFIYVNKAAANIFGYSKKEMIGKNLKELTNPKMFRKVLNKTSKSRGGKSHRYELTIIRKNGEHRIIAVAITPKFNDNSVYQGAFGIFHDITERKQAQEDLKLALEKATESDKLKSVFLNTMSHELRTPLNAIIGFSEMIADSGLSEEEIKDFANIIKTSGNNLLSIVNDIFDITLIETDKVQINKEEFSINETLEYIYSSFIGNDKILNNQINLMLNKELAEDSDIVYTDEIKFHQILINIVGNAFKFTHQGTIEFGYTVETDNDTSFLKFYVKDTGVGIPEDKQSIIFKRFRQADESSTRRFEGAGLGLFISEKLVKLLGGKIWMESEEGKGSIFYFTIPFEPVAKTTDVITDETKKPEFNWKDKTILIVDDNDEVYKFFEAVLKKTNARLVWAKDGKEALSLFESNKDMDLILMDIQLTDISGYEVTKQIKKINKDIPIIAQTSYALYGDREKSLKAGCDDYITKPIEKQVLLQMIEKYLNG